MSVQLLDQPLRISRHAVGVYTTGPFHSLGHDKPRIPLNSGKLRRHWIDALSPPGNRLADFSSDVTLGPIGHDPGNRDAMLAHFGVCPFLGFHLLNMSRLFRSVVLQVSMSALVQENIQGSTGAW